jgi:ketol-acid reductoisomerase
VRKSGKSWKQAKRDGLAVAEPARRSRRRPGGDAGARHGAGRALQGIKSSLKPGATLLFAHGFNVHFKQIKPRKDLDVVLIAPKGPGGLVRRQYQQGRGVPCLIAVAQDATGKAHAKALAYADGIGGTRGGVSLETSFAEETETDLFGEQAVLCGGATELVVAGLRDAGRGRLPARGGLLRVLHELKLIVDLLHEGGLAKMHRYISDTAKYGDLTRGPRVVNERTRKEMRKILKEIQSGKFARQWISEHQSGAKNYRRLLKQDLRHPIEKVGAKLRERMPWLKETR